MIMILKPSPRPHVCAALTSSLQKSVAAIWTLAEAMPRWATGARLISEVSGVSLRGKGVRGPSISKFWFDRSQGCPLFVWTNPAVLVEAARKLDLLTGKSGVPCESAFFVWPFVAVLPAPWPNCSEKVSLFTWKIHGENTVSGEHTASPCASPNFGILYETWAICSQLTLTCDRSTTFPRRRCRAWSPNKKVWCCNSKKLGSLASNRRELGVLSSNCELPLFSQWGSSESEWFL